MDYEIFAMQDKVAVKLTPPEERIGNILLPDTAKGDNHIGTIVSVACRPMVCGCMWATLW